MTRPSDKQVEGKHRENESGGGGKPDSSYATEFLIAFLLDTPAIYILYWISFGGGLGLDENPSPVQFFITALFSLLVLNAIVFQILVSQRQWKAMSLQERTMRGQLEVMNRQVETADRPWLAVDVAVIDPLTFSEQGGNLGFRIIAKNVGRSVAVNATINVKVIVPHLGEDAWQKALAEQIKVCETINSRFMAYAIFPERVYVVEHSFGLSPDDMRQGYGQENDRYIMPILVGCVDYQFSGHDAHHQTRFIYEVHGIDPDNPSIRLVLAVGKDVPVERLIAEKSFIGGDYAD